MKKLVCIAALLYCASNLSAQKKPLDLNAVQNWPEIKSEKISNNGKLVMYKIDMPSGADTLVFHPVDKSWIEKVVGVEMPVITEDSRYVIYKKRDSLYRIDVQKHQVISVSGQVASFRVPSGGTGQWLAWLSTGADKELFVQDLQRNKIYTYDHVNNYQFSENGKVLLLQRTITTPVIQWVNLGDSKPIHLMHGGAAVRFFAFDNAAAQVAFISNEQRDGKPTNVVRYYTPGLDSAVVRVHSQTSGIDSNFVIEQSGVRFSPDGRRLFFLLKAKAEELAKKSPTAADVNIWHYEDELLQTEQTVLNNLNTNKSCSAVIHKDASNVIQLNEAGDDSYIVIAGDGNGDFALVRRNTVNGHFSGKWRNANLPSYYVVNITNGERKKLLEQRDITITISPTGKYVLWYDPVQKAFFTYETTTGEQKNISRSIVGTLVAITDGKINPFLPFGVAGWLPDDRSVLIYDEFDVLKVDPKGLAPAVNLTNGYGRRNQVILRIKHEGDIDYDAPVITKKNLLLAAFDTRTKDNGFYVANMSHINDPVKLSMDACIYYAHYRFNFQFMTHYNIVKAAHANAYLIRRMRSDEYPNLFFTSDFQQYTQLSNLAPEQPYNWLRSELITFRQTDSQNAMGILYKPANFDSTKKYPVLFYFYEKLSYRLHQYLQPDISGGSINIPYYVSNGYLVFTPDISYTQGSPGESALNAVSSGARYLSQMPWVDSERMGLQGHSFGGYQVNYVVSHSNLFAAAQESAGASDFVSYYNGFYREHSAQFYFEYGQGRLGYTLWEKPEMYLQNSPIFNADKVQTPLLIMHNKDDGEVPFQQGIEWFTALRRLGKKVWLLQYDKEYHGLVQPKNQLDFTIRSKQFFDHYLKRAPAPKWMVSGVPAKLKGIDPGIDVPRATVEAK